MPSPPVKFLFRIDALNPQNGTGNRKGRHWTPPERSTEYVRQRGSLYRWTNGVVTSVPANDQARSMESSLREYQCTTVFTQWPCTPHFLAVPFDAQTQNVCDKGGWHELGFHHDSAHTGHIYSYLEIHGEHRHLAALSSARWVHELFPQQYHPREEPGQSAQATGLTGLTGKLTLLLAVIAFSSTEGNLDHVLRNSLRQREWIPHSQPDGREFSFSHFILEA